jgi:hypothetical protein
VKKAMSDMTLYLSNAVENGAKQAAIEFSKSCIRALSEHYNFDLEEALSYVNLENVTVKKNVEKKEKKRSTPSIPLPWTGVIVEGWCCGLRANHGLYSQCTMEPLKNGEYCKTCAKQACANSTGKPSYGNVHDRMNVDMMSYREPKTGKQVTAYGNVLSKLSISREKAEEEASKFGITIPEEQFAERASKRGRPKKDATASETSSSSSETSTPKKRGRPKKEKKLIAASTGDDLIAKLVADSQNSTLNGEDDVSSLSSADAETVDINAVKLARKQKKEEKIKNLQDELKKLSIELYGEETQINSTRKIGVLEKEIANVKAAIKKKDFVAYYDIETPTQAPAPAPPAPPAPAPAPPAPPAPEDNDEDEEEATNVYEFEFEGKNYLKNDDNVLFDVTTHEAVGVYNEETDTIDEIEEFSSDEEDDE